MEYIFYLRKITPPDNQQKQEVSGMSCLLFPPAGYFERAGFYTRRQNLSVNFEGHSEICINDSVNGTIRSGKVGGYYEF
jgi:hypothetical protein